MKKDIGVNASKGIMHKHRECENVIYQKMFRKMNLKSHHKQGRMNWVRKYMTTGLRFARSRAISMTANFETGRAGRIKTIF